MSITAYLNMEQVTGDRRQRRENKRQKNSYISDAYTCLSRIKNRIDIGVYSYTYIELGIGICAYLHILEYMYGRWYSCI
jgi:hypothetical protein